MNRTPRPPIFSGLAAGERTASTSRSLLASASPRGKHPRPAASRGRLELGGQRVKPSDHLRAGGGQAIDEFPGGAAGSPRTPRLRGLSLDVRRCRQRPKSSPMIPDARLRPTPAMLARVDTGNSAFHTGTEPRRATRGPGDDSFDRPPIVHMPTISNIDVLFADMSLLAGGLRCGTPPRTARSNWRVTTVLSIPGGFPWTTKRTEPT